MHARSGLTEEVRASTVDVADGRGAWCSTTSAATSSRPRPRRWPATRSPPTAASSPATCPTLDDYLHYRMIDVSSIKELCRRWYPRIYFGQPEKGLAHRALADIHESIRELQYYRRTAFVPPPGPSTSDIAAIAAELGPAERRRSDNRFGCRAPERLISTTPLSPDGSAAMVAVVQLVEHQVVILAVAGSSPVSHPSRSEGISPSDFFLSPRFAWLCRPRLRQDQFIRRGAPS